MARFLGVVPTPENVDNKISVEVATEKDLNMLGFKKKAYPKRFTGPTIPNMVKYNSPFNSK